LLESAGAAQFPVAPVPPEPPAPVPALPPDAALPAVPPDAALPALPPDAPAPLEPPLPLGSSSSEHAGSATNPIEHRPTKIALL